MKLHSTYILAALLAALVYALISRHRRSTTPPPPPGPPSFPLIGSIPFLSLELHASLAKLASTYGPIYSLRVGQMSCVVITSPSLARQVLRDHDSAMANHEPLASARVITYDANDIVWAPNGPTWRMLRRLCVHQILSPSSIEGVAQLRRQEIRTAVANLHIAGSKPVHIGEMVLLTILNVLMSMIWGGTMGEEERAEKSKEFREVIEEVVEGLSKPNLGDLFPGIAKYDLQGLQRRMGKLLSKFDKMFDEVIERKKKMGAAEGNGKDFLGCMLKLEAEGGDSKAKFTMTHVKALLVDMFLGGSDTTANTIEWGLAETMANPHIMSKVHEELDRVVGKDNIVEESHLSKLTYLSAVIKEVLRLHPAFPILVPHCPSSPCVVGRYTIPEGTKVIFNAWAIHRDPTLWEDPMEFKPERFLEEKELEYNGKDFRYLPFGSGRRICAGIPLAERMTSYLLASLLHSFEWEVADGGKVDLTEKFGVVLKPATPLVAVPTPRLVSSDLYS